MMARPVDPDNLALFRREMLEYVRSNDLNLSQLCRLCSFPVYRSSWLHGIMNGSIDPKRETMLVLRRAMNANPGAVPTDTPAQVAPVAGPPEPGFVLPNIAAQMDIAAKRDAAAAARAAWIEQQRQAEYAKYGFTTITRDVAEMVA